MNLGQRHRQQLHVPRHDELPGHRQPDQEQLDAFLHDATEFTHPGSEQWLRKLSSNTVRHGDILYLWGAEVRGHVWKWDGLKFRAPPYPHALPNLVSNQRQSLRNLDHPIPTFGGLEVGIRVDIPLNNCAS